MGTYQYADHEIIKYCISSRHNGMIRYFFNLPITNTAAHCLGTCRPSAHLGEVLKPERRPQCWQASPIWRRCLDWWSTPYCCLLSERPLSSVPPAAKPEQMTTLRDLWRSTSTHTFTNSPQLASTYSCTEVGSSLHECWLCRWETMVRFSPAKIACA